MRINEEFSSQLQEMTNRVQDIEVENKTLRANLDKAHKASKIRLEEDARAMREMEKEIEHLRSVIV